MTRAMLLEHGETLGCLKCTRVRTQRPAAGTRCSDECRRRFEEMARAQGDPRMVRACQGSTSTWRS
eukprot:11588673-Alexandrium_andersonii.AAC.1